MRLSSQLAPWSAIVRESASTRPGRSAPITVRTRDALPMGLLRRVDRRVNVIFGANPPPCSSKWVRNIPDRIHSFGGRDGAHKHVLWRRQREERSQWQGRNRGPEGAY